MSTYKKVLVAIDLSNESTKVIARARELVVGSGAIGATLDLANHYADQAKGALSILPASDWRAALESLADFAVSRAA